MLDAAHRLPPGGVALYYLKPGQTDYSEAQKVYAKVTAPGVYTFDLGGSGSRGCALTRTAWAACRRCLPALI